MASAELGIRKGYPVDQGLSEALAKVERESAHDQVAIKKAIYTIDGKPPVDSSTYISAGLTLLFLCAGIIPLLIGGLPLLGLTAIPMLLATIPAFKVAKDVSAVYEQKTIKDIKINNRKLGEAAEKEKLYQEDRLKRQEDEIKRNPQKALAEAPSRSVPARKKVTLDPDAVANSVDTSSRQATLPQALQMPHPANAASRPAAVASPGGTSSALGLGHLLASSASHRMRGQVTPSVMQSMSTPPSIASLGSRSFDMTPIPFDYSKTTARSSQGNGLHQSATRDFYGVSSSERSSPATQDGNPQSTTALHSGGEEFSPRSLQRSPRAFDSYSTPYSVKHTDGRVLTPAAPLPRLSTPTGGASAHRRPPLHAHSTGKPADRRGYDSSPLAPSPEGETELESYQRLNGLFFKSGDQLSRRIDDLILRQRAANILGRQREERMESAERRVTAAGRSYHRPYAHSPSGDEGGDCHSAGSGGDGGGSDSDGKGSTFHRPRSVEELMRSADMLHEHVSEVERKSSAMVRSIGGTPHRTPKPNAGLQQLLGEAELLEEHVTQVAHTAESIVRNTPRGRVPEGVVYRDSPFYGYSKVETPTLTRAADSRLQTDQADTGTVPVILNNEQLANTVVEIFSRNRRRLSTNFKGDLCAALKARKGFREGLKFEDMNAEKQQNVFNDIYKIRIESETNIIRYVVDSVAKWRSQTISDARSSQLATTARTYDKALRGARSASLDGGPITYSRR